MGNTTLKNRKIDKNLYGCEIKKPSYSVLTDEIVPVATNYLCLICIIIYFVDIFTGYKLTTIGIKDNNSVIDFGAVYRLFTCTLLHANIVHLLSNLIFIKYYGSKGEAYFGAKKYIMVIIASGFTGSLCSLAFTEGRSVGASGIAFGLVGALLSIRYAMDEQEKARITRGCYVVIIINLLIGFTSSGIDNAAHIGGFFGGLFIGYALGVFKEPERESIKKRAIYAYAALNILLAFEAYYHFLPKVNILDILIRVTGF